jgi:uncharacterized membrane protein
MVITVFVTEALLGFLVVAGLWILGMILFHVLSCRDDVEHVSWQPSLLDHSVLILTVVGFVMCASIAFVACVIV